MEEYMRFPSVSSPWLLEADSVAKKFMVHSVDQDTRKCTFLLYETGLFKLDKSTVQEGSLLLNSLFKLTYSYDEGYLPSVLICFTPQFIAAYFGTVTNTDKTRNKICEVSEGCEGVNVGLTREQCTKTLESLPILTNVTYLDGKDFGCRVLHAAFAERNDKHCPHISFEPLEDSNGKLKCQTSANIQVSDHFDDLILKDYVSAFCMI